MWPDELIEVSGGCGGSRGDSQWKIGEGECKSDYELQWSLSCRRLHCFDQDSKALVDCNISIELADAERSCQCL